MNICFGVNPLTAFPSSSLAQVCEEEWKKVRPNDHCESVLLSDGVCALGVGSGIDDIMSREDALCIELGPAHLRHFMWVNQQQIVIDYTGVIGGFPLSHEDSSAIIGQDLRNIAVGELGRDLSFALPSTINLVLPTFSSIADMGIGLLEALLGDSRRDIRDGGRFSEWVWKDYSPQSRGQEVLAHARTLLAHWDIRVLVSQEQALIGLSGVARGWQNAGMDPRRAQEYEEEHSALLSRLHRLVSHNHSSLMPTFLPLISQEDAEGSSQRNNDRNISAYDGVCSGVGYILRILGARIFPVSALRREKLEAALEQCDLYVHISGSIKETIPSTLILASSLAERRALPVVLLYERGGVRRGEYAQWGVHGAYELFPEYAHIDNDVRIEESDDASDFSAEMSQAWQMASTIRKKMSILARTWGWDDDNPSITDV